MKVFLLVAAACLLTTTDTCGQPQKPLTPNEVKKIQEVNLMLQILHMTYNMGYSPGITPGAYLREDHPPFLPQQPSDKAIPFGWHQIFMLAEKMTATHDPQDQSYTENAVFNFKSSIEVTYDQQDKIDKQIGYSYLKVELLDADQDGYAESLISEPMEKLGGHRLLFTSDLRNAKDEQLRFHTDQNQRVTLIFKKRQYSNFPIEFKFYSGFPADSILSGTLQMQLIPPTEYLQVVVPLNNASKGKTFELDGVPFTLCDFGPGDVIIASDTLHKKQICTWERTHKKDGEYIRASQSGSNLSYKALLMSVAPRPPFGEWLRNMALFEMEEYGVTRQQLTSYQKRVPSAAEAKKIHQIVGALCGANLKGYKAEADYDQTCREQMIINFEKYRDGANAFELRMQAGEQMNHVMGMNLGIMIGQIFQGVNLEPNFKQIYKGIQKYLAKNPDYDEQLLAQLNKQAAEFTANYETLPLTDADIAALDAPAKDPFEHHPGVFSIWYKTNIDADTLIYYTPKPLDKHAWMLQTTYYRASDSSQTQTSRTPQEDGWWDSTLPLDHSEFTGETFIEETAAYKGQACSIAYLTQLISPLLRYPEQCAQQGIEGTVSIRFSISEQDQICDLAVVSSPHPALTQEVLRVMRMPEYMHATRHGKYVKNPHTLRLTFKL